MLKRNNNINIDPEMLVKMVHIPKSLAHMSDASKEQYARRIVFGQEADIFDVEISEEEAIDGSGVL